MTISIEQITMKNTAEIDRQIFEILADVSDEIGEAQIDDGYLLKYEGWGGFCVEEVWANVENKQKESGIDNDSESAKAERESACYKHAADQTTSIIENEWIPEMKKRGYVFIDGGYDEGGLYGRTWALFKELRRRKFQ